MNTEALPLAADAASARKARWQGFERRVIGAVIPLYVLATGTYGLVVPLLLGLCLITGAIIDGLAGFFRQDPHIRGNRLIWFLFPLALPAGIPLWMGPCGLIFALVIAVHFFGGYRRNLFNTIAVGVVFLQLSYPAVYSQALLKPFFPPTLGFSAFRSGMGVAEPVLPALRSHPLVSWSDHLWGQVPGNLGECFPLAVLLIGVFLLVQGFLDLRLVVSGLVGLAMFSALGNHVFPLQVLPFFEQLLVGAFLPFLLLFSLDVAALPRTPGGRWFWGIQLAFFTVLIRGFSGFSEGVFFAALLTGVFSPMFDRLSAVFLHQAPRRVPS